MQIQTAFRPARFPSSSSVIREGLLPWNPSRCNMYSHFTRADPLQDPYLEELKAYTAAPKAPRPVTVFTGPPISTLTRDLVPLRLPMATVSTPPTATPDVGHVAPGPTDTETFLLFLDAGVLRARLTIRPDST